MIFFILGEGSKSTTTAPVIERRAIISCWITASDSETAVEMAKTELAQYGWKVFAVYQCDEANDTNVPIDHPGRQFYDQAQIDGTVYEVCEYADDDDSHQ